MATPHRLRHHAGATVRSGRKLYTATHSGKTMNPPKPLDQVREAARLQHAEKPKGPDAVSGIGTSR